MRRLALSMFAIGCGLLLAGCPGNNGDDGLTAEQKTSGDRLTQILEKAGGDWNKLTSEDRSFLVNDMSNGNEQAARMKFQMMAGRKSGITPGPGGARPGGPGK